MTIKKFWIIKDGVVGTAHLNRDKKTIVDFRKANVYPDYPDYPPVFKKVSKGKIRQYGQKIGVEV